MLKTIRDIDVKGKKVFLRCDFNVPLDERGEIEDDFRIKQTIPTIKYLIKNRAKIILASHNLEMDSVAKKLSSYLKTEIKKNKDCISREVEKEAGSLKEGEVLLLGDLRAYKEEKNNDEKFAKKLADLADVYINDAFGASHRPHASIVSMPKFLPAAAGLLLEKEVKILSRVLKNPWRPLVAVIGGVKIESKLKVINQFLEKADDLIIGGRIADTILAIKGICIGKFWTEDKETIKGVEKIDLTFPKLHLPIDALISPDKTGKIYIRNAALAKVRSDELALDIGPESIEIFSRIIKSAKMIIWSGPLGFFEEPCFENGTKLIAESIARNHNAFKVAGGGDTVAALNKFGLRDKFDHVSTGGGAMLAFLGGEKLPGLEVLEK